MDRKLALVGIIPDLLLIKAFSSDTATKIEELTVGSDKKKNKKKKQRSPARDRTQGVTTELRSHDITCSQWKKN